MSEFMAMLAANAVPVGVLMGLASLFAIYLAAREPFNYFFMDLFYGLPLVGKLGALSRDSTKSRKTGWLISEETLCGDYGKYVNTVSEREFWRGAEYMRKAGDTGRKPLSVAMMVLLGVLIAAESLGFSFLLSTAMAQEGSANLHTIMTFAVTLVLAIVFAYFMHAAGAQLHRSGLIGHAEKTWRDDGQSVDLTNGSIDLKTDQGKDDDKPDYVQLISRVGRNKSYGAVIGAGILIALVAIGSTYMRIQHANSALVQEAISAGAASGTDNPFADAKPGLPDEARASQDEALRRAREEATSASGRESYAAFVVLGVIFVFTQFVGVMFGMKYGFAGSQGGDAFKLTRGFGTYDEYLRSFAGRIHTAEARLRNLQQRMASHSGSKALDLNGDFETYLRRRHAGGAGGHVAVAPSPAPSPAPAPAPAPVVEAAASPQTVAEALAALDALSDVAQKKTLTLTLPDALRAEVVAAIKTRKAQAAAMSELDDVF